MTIQFYSACFFSLDNGATVQRRASGAEEQHSALPAGVTNLLRLDETQPNNKSLLDGWAAPTPGSAAYKMSGNNLLVSGQTAGVDPPGLIFSALQNAQSLYSKATTTPDAFTREEQAQILALTFRALGLV